MRIFATAALSLVVAGLWPDGAAAALYACDLRDIRRINADGMAVRDDETRAGLRTHPRFTFDDRTGRITGMREGWVLSLLQKAVGQNALLAVSIHKGVGNTGLQILKIDTFRQDRMPFVWISDDEITTGVCTVGRH